MNRAEAKTTTLASLVEHSGDFIGVAHLDGTVLFVNPAGRKLTGRAPDQMPENVVDCVFPADRSLVGETIWPAVMRSGSWEGEIRLLNAATAAPLPVHAHTFTIIDAATESAVAIATICRDISAVKATEEALRKAREELAHIGRVSSMGQLSASIAHEMNQPLGAIVNDGNACLHWLRGVTPNVAEALAAVQRIIRDANRASAVIRGIREFLTRGEAAKVEIVLEDLIGHVIDLVRRDAASHEVTLLFLPTPGVPPVFGNRTQLQQVLLNLVMNAIDALSGMSDGARRVVLRAHCDGENETRVTVCDSGPGIQPDRREQVFDAFYTDKDGGMGLGLAISRSIVRAHGGRIWATPNEGARGETFQFTLPVGSRT